MILKAAWPSSWLSFISSDIFPAAVHPLCILHAVKSWRVLPSEDHTVGWTSTSPTLSMARDEQTVQYQSLWFPLTSSPALQDFHTYPSAT